MKTVILLMAIAVFVLSCETSSPVKREPVDLHSYQDKCGGKALTMTLSREPYTKGCTTYDGQKRLLKQAAKFSRTHDVVHMRNVYHYGRIDFIEFVYCEREKKR